MLHLKELDSAGLYVLGCCFLMAHSAAVNTSCLQSRSFENFYVYFSSLYIDLCAYLVKTVIAKNKKYWF